MRHLNCLLAISTFALTTITPLRGQTGKSDWGNLRQVQSGQQVETVLKDAKSYRGTLQSVNDDGITIRGASEEQTFLRANVLRVSIKGKGHRLRNAVIGAGVGAGAGAVIGAAICPPHGFCDRGQFIAFGAPVVGLIGAAVGVLIPTGGWHEVYRTARSQ
jgi:hypothetical protein